MPATASLVRIQDQLDFSGTPGAGTDGYALSLSSLYGFIQQAQESAVSGTTLTVKQTDGSTTLGTKTLTVSAAADPVTGIA